MTTKNAYEVLGVAETASAAAIKTTHRKLSLETHPDRNPGNQEKDAQFKEVQAAYGVLSDPEKRLVYDAKLGADRAAALAARKADEKARLEREAAAQAQVAREAAAQVRVNWEALFQKPAQASSIWPRPTPMPMQPPPSTPVSRPSFSTEGKVIVGGLALGLGGILLAAMFSGSKGGSHWDPSAQRNRDNDNGQFRSS
jgi:curved DNA-binding protein CbpA